MNPNAYAHKCCKTAGIKSRPKHYRYKKPGEPRKVYPNLILAGLKINGPVQCIVSDMTAFRLKGVYYELTLYMDLWNSEILSHSLSAKRGDRMTYISGLNGLTELKKQYPEYKMVLHSDQGSVYASKNYNELLGPCGIIHSMSRAGTPTDNAAMESINGWIKSELFTDFHLQGENIEEEMAAYIKFFNEERPAYSLGYLTPRQYRETIIKIVCQKIQFKCPIFVDQCKPALAENRFSYGNPGNSPFFPDTEPFYHAAV